MSNKSRQCEKCPYRTHNAKAMERHNSATGHNRSKKEVRYVQIGKFTKKVK